MTPETLFDYDPLAGAFTWKSGRPAGSRNAGLRVSVDKKRHLAVDLIWQIMTGSAPAHRIAYLNGDMYDLRWGNLYQKEHAATEVTQEGLHLMATYDPVTGVLRWRDTGLRLGSFNTQSGREYVTLGGRRYELCDIAWLYVYGELPPRKVNCKDGDILNYTVMNMELVPADSVRQRRRRVKHDGIFWIPEEGHWLVRHTYGEASYPLGVYTDIEKARLARREFNAHADNCITQFMDNPEEWQAAFNENPAAWTGAYWLAVTDKLGAEGGLDYEVSG